MLTCVCFRFAVLPRKGYLMYNAHLLQAIALKEISFRGFAEEIGICPATLRSYLRGRTQPDIVIALEMARVLGVNEFWLWMEEPSRSELDDIPKWLKIVKKTAMRRESSSTKSC